MSQTSISSSNRNLINYKSLIGAGLIFTGAICFSTKAILVKLAYQYNIDAISLLNLRMIFSLPFFLGVAIFSKKNETSSISGSDVFKICILGVLGYYVASILDFEGLKYITAGLERLILFIYPTIVVVISAMVYRKSITKVQYIALTLTYIGVAIAFSYDLNMSTQKDVVKGATLIFFCAIAYALYIFGSGRMISRIGTLRFTAYAMTVSSIVVIVHSWISNGEIFVSFPVEVYILSIMMAILATVIPSFMISEGIRRIGADNASIISSVGPISTIILAYIFLN